jgi:hypothetical protein
MCQTSNLDDVDQNFLNCLEIAMEVALIDMCHVDTRERLAKSLEISMHLIKLSNF